MGKDQFTGQISVEWDKVSNEPLATLERVGGSDLPVIIGIDDARELSDSNEATPTDKATGRNAYKLLESAIIEAEQEAAYSAADVSGLCEPGQ